MTASGRSRRWWRPLVGSVLFLASLAFLVRTAGDGWGSLAARADAPSAVATLAGLGVAALAMTLMAVGWRPLLAAEPPPLGRVLRWYFTGEIGKYLPGGVWAVVGRAELAARGGIDRRPAYRSVALSLIWLYVVAAAVTAVGLLGPVANRAERTLQLVALVVAVVAPLLLWTPVQARLAARLPGPLRRTVTGRADAAGRSVPAAALTAYGLAWFAVGTATWLAGRALVGPLPWWTVAQAAVASWFAGFIAVGVPGGLGVREAFFVLSVAPAGSATGLSGADALAVAALARLLFITVDGGGALVGVLAGRRGAGRGRPRRVAGSPGGPADGVVGGGGDG